MEDDGKTAEMLASLSGNQECARIVREYLAAVSVESVNTPSAPRRGKKED